MKRVLNMFSYLLSLRNFFAAVTVVLLLAPLSLAWLKQPNQFLFGIGAHLTPKPQTPSQIVRILIPPSEMDRLIRDMPGALALGNALQGLRGVFTKGVLLVVDELPNTDNYATDILVSRLVNDSSVRESLQASGLLSDIEALGQRRDNYYSQVQDGSLLLGVAESALAKDKVNYLRESTLVPVAEKDTTAMARVLAFFKPVSLLLTKFRYESKTSAYPAYSDVDVAVAYPLLWRVGDDYFPDAVLALLKKSQGAAQITHRARGDLAVGDTVIPVSDGNRIYPMFSSASGVVANIETVSLAELKNPADYNRFHNKSVLIGVKDSQSFTNITSAYYSLEKRAYYTVPDWYLWVEKGGLLLLLCYLFLILPRLPIKMGLVVSGFLALAFVVAQLGLQISQMLWLPTGLLLAYLFIGHMAALLWMLQKDIFQLPATNTKTNKRTNGVAKQKLREEPRMATTKADSFLARTLAIKTQKFSLGRYQIDSELGRGAMGVVYLGHDPNIDRKVAIKTLSFAQIAPDERKEAKERFLREARAVGKFDPHPNIVAVYDNGEDTERAFIAMEYVDGKPLSAHTQKNTLIKEYDELYWIIESVANALSYAHQQGVVHRDIKPSNILYDENNNKVKVSDFGVARIINSSATRTGEILGSPLYMSPEQVKGETVTGKTDIYSLGVTFYQLLTGQLPFTGDSMPAITHQIVHGKYTAVTELNPKIPDSANRIIARSMHKDPEKRYATAEDMMNDIAKYRSKGF